MDSDATKDTLIREHVLRSTIVNYIGELITLGTGFFLTPFILHQLGDTSYGLWVLVGSLVAYGSLLDFGITGAVIKYVAEFRTQGEVEQARGLVATALTLYTGLGLLAVALSAIIAPVFPDLFDVPPGERTTAVWLVLLSGLSVGISVPCTITTSVLRGLQRFDLVNVVSTGGTLLVALATIVVLLLGGGVLGMVAVNIVVTLVMQIPAIVFIRRTAPELEFGWRRTNPRFIRMVISFSSSVFLSQVSSRLETKTDEIVIGAFLPIAAVTPYSLARRLSAMAQKLTNQFMKVLLPLASELQAEQDSTRLRALYVTSTRLTMAIFLPIGGTLVVLAGPVLTAWVGAQYAEYAYLVLILTAASFIDTSQWPAGSVMQGIAQHRPLAVASLLTALANLALSIVLGRTIGLAGVALGTLIPTTIATLGFVLPYTMRVIDVPLAKFVKGVALPALVPAVPMFATLYGLRHLIGTESLLFLALVAGAGVVVYAGCYLVIGASDFERHTYRTWARSTFRTAVATLKSS